MDTYTYNGLGLRVAKSDSTGSYSYVCDGTTPGSPVLSDGHTVFTAGLSSTVAGLTSFRHDDLLGSLRFLTDSSQGVQANRLFSGFGATVATSGAAWEPFGWAGAAGDQTDADTGLVLMGHRLYDSRLGWFLSQDPAGDGDNWYAYCDNDPINGLDPSGQFKIRFSDDDLRSRLSNGGDYSGEKYTLSEQGLDWYNPDNDTHYHIARYGEHISPSNGTSDASMGFGGMVDEYVTFGLIANAGRMAGGYDAGKVSRGAAVGAGALAVGAIVAAGASDGEDAGVGAEAKVAEYETKAFLKSLGKAKYKDWIAKGTDIREVEDLVRDYGGSAKNWVKMKGWMPDPAADADVEIHWYENMKDSIGRVKAKLK